MTRQFLLSFVGLVFSSITAQAGPRERVRLIEVPTGSARVEVWRERVANGGVIPFYSIDPDGPDGPAAPRVVATSYQLGFDGAAFDPLVGATVNPSWPAANPESCLHVVQFWTQPLDDYRKALRDLGATVRHYIPRHAYLVEIEAERVGAVAALPFVRWVGPYQPAYKLEPGLRDVSAGGKEAAKPRRYNIMVVERGGLRQKQIVADRIRAMGGTIDALISDGFLLEATITLSQLRAIVVMDEVIYIDQWSKPIESMDIAREIGGANYVEGVAGYTGAGVRGEVQEIGIAQTTHTDFQEHPPLIHLADTMAGHGTSTFGILFGSGIGNAAARGLLSSGQGITSGNVIAESYNMYTHTSELLQAPYFASFQSNSWGTVASPRRGYGTRSALVDDVLFHYDIVFLWAFGNWGGFLFASNQQANAKNVISVGGIRHQNTLTKSDDSWEGGPKKTSKASFGPTDDGRIKPDLAHFYDNVLTTTLDNGYRSDFGGTSAATPITAGHFGLFFQMWNDGLFGNTVPHPGGTVFENRPHAATAKAMMINTAAQYPFKGASHDLSRYKQGWGMADVKRLYDARDSFPVIIDESDVLTNLSSTQYPVTVAAGQAAFRATLVYTDPMGVPGVDPNRINDLTLKVTSPSDVVYWGNHGLVDGNWSVPGGSANMIDTVENVFVENPEAGTWTVEVFADEVNADGHTETSETDVDYALVVSIEAPPLAPGDIDGDGDLDNADINLFTHVLLGIDTGDPEHVARSDLNDDSSANGNDIQTMVAALLN